jgi:hypothetical protein
MKKACDNCGAENPLVARFCRQCGKPWAQAWLRSVTCVTPLMQQWRALRHRMTRKEVRSLLGEPARIETALVGCPALEVWAYGYEPVGGGERLRGTVQFVISEGTVAAWTEPDWAAPSGEHTEGAKPAGSTSLREGDRRS